MIKNALGLSLDPATLQTYRRQFTPIFARIKTYIDATHASKIPPELRNPSGASSAKEISDYLNRILESAKSSTPTIPTDQIPAPLESLKPASFDAHVYDASYLLLAQYIAENK